MVNVFSKLDTLLKNGKKISKRKIYIIKNLVQKHNYIKDNRQISNNLLKPHYFFTPRYIEGPKPSQIRQ
jgi:hypothetical protein